MPAPLAVRRAAAAAGLLGTAWLTGCSPDPGPIGTVDGAPTPSRAEIAEGLATLYAGPAGSGTAGAARPRSADAREADCFGRALAAAVPPETLRDAGLLVDRRVVEQAPALPEPLARQWFTAQQACADFVEVSTRAQADATKGRLDREAYAACLRASAGPDLVEEAVVATLTGSWDDPAVTRLARAQAGCAATATGRRAP